MRSSARTAPGRPGTIIGSAGATPSTISSASPAARSRSGSSPNCATERPDMADRNPRTVEEARALVARVESLFTPWDVPALLAGFTDDCVVRFGDLPELRGKAALERLFRGRSERQKGYRLRKEFRALMGDIIANYWEGEWDDQVTGAKMVGRGV